MSNGIKWMISIVIVCIMVGATVAVIYYVLGTEDPCTKILKSMSERKIIQGVDMNPMAMAACRLKFCEVDLSECPISCPFSYETDDKTQCPKSCECATSGIYQGDIRFGEDEVDRMMTRYGHREEEEFSLFFGTAFEIWNQTIVNGRMKVPYKMSPNVLYSTLDAWNLVVEDYGKKSCIDLIHWTDENDYLNVVETVNCASAVGRGFGSQMLELGVGCGIRATIQHELMHAFGFDHEQSRPDRDLHVTIHPENIEPYYLHNFDKLEERKVLDLGTEYEKRSGLHYGSDDFGINGATSMTFKPGEEVIITRTEERLLTEEDFRELNILYRCKLEMDGPVVGSWKQWASWSECSVSCLKGYQTRSRDCYDPSGVKVGNCEGGTFEYRDCDSGECPPPDGIYDEWTEWGTCGRECGIGEKRRYRSCPLKYKNGCKGVFGIHHIEEQKTCQLKTCDGSPMQPIHTEWGSEWIRSTCGATCGGSRESLHLRCHCGPGICHIYNCDPEYSFTETAEDWDPMSLMKWVPCATEPCEGDNSEQTSVTEAPEVIQPTSSTLSPDQYPEPSSSSPESVSMWSEWGPWSACDKSCGDGHQSRSRQCSDFNCDGHGYEMMVCFVMSCPGSPFVPEVIQPTSSTLSPDLGPQYPDPWPSVPGPQPQFPDPWPSVPGPQPQFPDPWPSVPGPQPQFPDPWSSVPGSQPQYPDPWPSVPEPQPQFPDAWPSVPGPQSQFPDPWLPFPGPHPQFPNPRPPGPVIHPPHPISSPFAPNPGLPNPTIWPSLTDSSWPAVTVEPVGTWSDWGPWGQCDKVCGNGHMIRTRNCLEYICTGVYYDMLPCLIEPCPGPPADDFSEYGDYVSDYFGEEDPSPTPLPNKDLFKTTWLRFKNFCPHGKIMTGYFNDDKFEDFLCYYKDGNIGLYFSSRSGVSEKLDWAGHTSACLHFDDVFARDVTGDGMDDLICRNTNTKNIEILINHGGSFSNAADWRGQRPICQKLHEVLNVEDLNGDGKADLVCGDHGSALQQVIFHE